MAKKYRIEFTDDNMENMKLYIDEQEKPVNFVKLTYHTNEQNKKGTKKAVLRYFESNTHIMKTDIVGNEIGLLDIVPFDFD